MKKNKRLTAIGFILVIFCSTLGGCFLNSSLPDGPPKQDVDVSLIKNAKPEVLPESDCGNPKSYEENGVTYHVLPSALGYKETGVASWYGTKFDNRKASDGEIYSMYDMVAAHKTLPIPCFAKVTNLENGRSIIVKIIDRGPFVSNRIIDLSYVAAKKLDILKKGTGKVKVEVINPRTWNKKPKPKPKIQHQPNVSSHRKGKEPAVEQKNEKISASASYVQIGAYESKNSAIVKKSQLKKVTRFPVLIEPVTVGSKKLYRVKIGPIANQKEKENLSEKIHLQK